MSHRQRSLVSTFRGPGNASLPVASVRLVAVVRDRRVLSLLKGGPLSLLTMGGISNVENTQSICGMTASAEVKFTTTTSGKRLNSQSEREGTTRREGAHRNQLKYFDMGHQVMWSFATVGAVLVSWEWLLGMECTSA